MKFKNLKKKIKILLIFFLVPLLTSCQHDIALMNPKGRIALEQRSLILTSFGLMLIVVIPVIVLTIIFSISYRSTNKKSVYQPDWFFSKKIELVIWSIPIFIVTLLSILIWKSTNNLNPDKPITSKDDPIVIEVISLDWKWLFIYPKESIASINKLVFPVNSPIRFKITSGSVMNSFFIPKLGSQIYAMFGMCNKLNLIANEPGVYKGISANFSGREFSKMKFSVVVTGNKSSFQNWIKDVKSSKKSLKSFNDYKKLEQPTTYSSEEYFSFIKPNLFQEILTQKK